MLRRRWGEVMWVLALAIGAVGCGSTQTIVKTVTSDNSNAVPATSSTTATATSAAAQKAKVGDKLTLHGNAGEAMEVTVDGVMDPLQVGQADQADAGHRFVGVQVTLKNVGSVSYSDSPSNGATLLSDASEQATRQIVSGGPCGNGFQSSANIAPGDTQQGCLPFELPTGQTPASFQFTLNSGFADQTGQWSLAGATAPPSPGTSASASSAGSSTATSNSSPAAGTKQCDPNISSGSTTSCAFAENVFRAVAAGYQRDGQIPSQVTATSPVTNQSYSLNCTTDASQLITCTSTTGATATFSLHSVQVY